MGDLLDRLRKYDFTWVVAGCVLVGMLLGVGVGVLVGWGTVKVINTTPDVLRPDLQEDYLRMAIDSFGVNQKVDLFVARWQSLGAVAPDLLKKIQSNLQGADPTVVQKVSIAMGKLAAASGTPVAQDAGSTAASTGVSTAILIGAVVALGLVAVAALYYFKDRLFSAKGSPRSGSAQRPLSAKSSGRGKTNFENLGVSPPIAQTMTTYALGDDLYDESFSIDGPGGDFLGEYGVGISETIGIGEPKKVTALEIWLFDKNDIKTATKVLMSQHAFGDPSVRTRLEAKGELIPIEQDRQVMLETDSLQLLATVVEMQYGESPLPQNSFFDRVTLELSIWKKS